MIYNVSPPIDRVFLEIGSLTIYWYAVIIVSGVFIGLWLATREANRLGLQKDLFADLIMFALPIAIISARAYYVIFEWDQYRGGPWWDVFAVWQGGIAIHGALIGSVITAIIFARVKNVSFWQLADIAAPSLILGQAIGRWGNFVNQEAHGGVVSEAFFNNFMQYLPDFIVNQMYINGEYYHPTFLYESVWNILIFILLLVIRRKVNPRRGELFLTYLIGYSIGRYFIEEMRTDSLYIVGSLRTAQVISIVIVLISIAIIIYRRKTKLANRHYNGKKVA
ncbi:prolipoprotein diacylglyceryl transferase [Paraliobacillus ryukyuensis]|uniref:prolipoprotein diacylglyceryl transferase n=1 Tax=Paraliobacillus ryukyuensis TaxID=200904 RepID=UPI00351D070E